MSAPLKFSHAAHAIIRYLRNHRNARNLKTGVIIESDSSKHCFVIINGPYRVTRLELFSYKPAEIWAMSKERWGFDRKVELSDPDFIQTITEAAFWQPMKCIIPTAILRNDNWQEMLKIVTSGLNISKESGAFADMWVAISVKIEEGVPAGHGLECSFNDLDIPQLDWVKLKPEEMGYEDYHEYGRP